MNNNKVDKHYVSEIDKRLKEFRETHAKSQSQIAEIDKYNKIYELRDNPNAKSNKESSDLWD